MVRPALAVSAPGKVLFTGGFLVLDRKHTGLVLGLDARIHVRIESWDAPETPNESTKSSKILVQSPQFHDAKWLYALAMTPANSISVEQITE